MFPTVQSPSLGTRHAALVTAMCDAQVMDDLTYSERFLRANRSRRLMIAPRSQWLLFLSLVAVCLFLSHARWLFGSAPRCQTSQLEDVFERIVGRDDTALLATVWDLVATEVRYTQQLDDAGTDPRSNASFLACTLGMWMMPERCGQPHPLSLRRCLLRRGFVALDSRLPARCRRSAYWRQFYERLPTRSVDSTLSMPRLAEHGYVPPQHRTFLRNVPVLNCSNLDRPFVAFPISYAMPAELFVARVPDVKVWDFFPVATRLHEKGPFRSVDESLVHELYRRSLFGFTHRRGGWDCWRHLEIIAAGALPYMPDLGHCGPLCLAFYPKHLFRQALALDGVAHLGSLTGPHSRLASNAQALNPNYFVTRPEVTSPQWVDVVPGATLRVNRDRFNVSAYRELVAGMLVYGRRFLTTRALVSYILHNIGLEEPRSVLLMVRPQQDYMEFAVEHGLASLGINYTVNHHRDWLRQVPGAGTERALDRRRRLSKLDEHHGRGIGYAFRLPTTTRVQADLATLASEIQSGVFDLVMYAYLWPPAGQLPLMDTVSARGVRVAIVDGNDNLSGEDTTHLARDASQYGTYFGRELSSGPCTDA
jgi:hypothetical protein